ncbi:MAG: hypothetical protein ACRDVG_03690, partial [Jatrophihabitantaceae bacterium]
VVAAVPAAAATPRGSGGGAAPHVARAHSTPTRAPGTFVPIRPFRAADTRFSMPFSRHNGPLHARQTMVVQLGGRRGVPASNVSAVAVTVSALTPTANGALTVFAYHGVRPATTNLIYRSGRGSAIAAISRVSPAGDVDIYNAARSGGVQIAVDVSGYYVGGGPSSTNPGVLHLLTTPQRAADSRTGGHGAFRPHETRTFALGHGVPTRGVGAAAVMLTALSPIRAGALTAYAAGNDPPLATTPRTTPFAAGQSTTQFAIVPTNASGAVSVLNGSASSVQVVVDVVGWTNAGVTQTAGTLQPRYPSRVANSVAVAANHTIGIPVGGLGGVPIANISAVIASITVVGPTAPGALVAWDGSGSTAPAARTLQYAARQSVADLAFVPLSAAGKIWVRNVSSGGLKLFVDVVGFVPRNTIAAPHTSTSHYIRNLLSSDSPDQIATKMAPIGQADASNGTTLSVLEFGAQTITSPLDKDHPGVLQTGTDERLTYDQVKAAVTGYEQGFGTGSVTIAVGTNNAGAYDGTNAYDPLTRGTEWETKVVGPLHTAATNNFTVIGANDIENGPGFDQSTDSLQHAQLWEDAYNAANPAMPLYFDGSADQCPDSFGPTHRACAPGWTQDDYYNLAYGRFPEQIRALPQIYTISQATQWVNIDRSGGSEMKLAGALTERASCASASPDCPTASYTGPNGWAALVRGLATLPGSHPVPAVTDLKIN